MDVRVLADAEHAAVPGRNERDDERRERQRAAGEQEILVAVLPAARGSDAEDERRGEVGADDERDRAPRAFRSPDDA